MGESEISAAGDREGTYRFFANLCLKPPSDSLVDMIRDGSILSALQENGRGRADLRWLPEFVEQAERITNIKDELEAEHAALFVLPSGVLPHEAVYLDREKRLGGRITVGVRQFYENAGAAVLDDCIEMPDHIGMELEFMGFLCAMEKKLRENADQSSLRTCIKFQKTFLEEHLSKWAYQCCEEITGHATYGFYKAIAHFIMEFLRCEEEYIAGLYAKVCREGENICEAVN